MVDVQALRAIPADLVYEDQAGPHRSHQVGRLAHAAADEIERLRFRLTRLAGIEAALKERGLFAFEHIDGTFSINER